MIKKLLKQSLLGLMSGFTIMTIVLFIFMLSSDDPSIYLTKSYLIRNIWSSALVGLAFSIPALIYNHHRFSISIQTLIHMGTGLVVFFPIAFNAAWIPVSEGTLAIVLSIVSMVVLAFAVWFGFYIYYRHEAKMINIKIKQKETLS